MISEDQALQILIAAGWTYWYPEENHYFMSLHDKSFLRDPENDWYGHQVMAPYKIHMDRTHRPTLF